jgi:hypothetical protein
LARVRAMLGSHPKALRDGDDVERAGRKQSNWWDGLGVRGNQAAPHRLDSFDIAP